MHPYASGQTAIVINSAAAQLDDAPYWSRYHKMISQELLRVEKKLAVTLDIMISLLGTSSRRHSFGNAGIFVVLKSITVVAQVSH